jgi:hypothetical protein
MRHRLSYPRGARGTCLIFSFLINPYDEDGVAGNDD